MLISKNLPVPSLNIGSSPVIIGLALIVLIIITVTKSAYEQVFGVSIIVGNNSGQDNSSFMNGKSMAMPDRNMTFGSALQNAKMHLTEAIMDLKEGDNKGALMQLNMTNQEIITHEKELEKMLVNR
jgi:hypothetical protein